MLQQRRAFLNLILRSVRLHPGAPDRSIGVIREWFQRRDDHELALLLDSAGVIPELIAPDSSEEKMYDRAMHALLGIALERLGYEAGEQDPGDPLSPVRARWLGRHPHTFHIEPRSVRLSRTATNPKDFAFRRIGTRRHSADCTVLVAPIVAFPLGHGRQGSRIYREARESGVVLATYVHIAAILRAGGRRSLSPIADSYEFASIAPLGGHSFAATYWWALDQQVAAVMSVGSREAEGLREVARDILRSLSRSETARICRERTNIRRASRAQLTALALEGRRVEERLSAMRTRTGRAVEFLAL